MKIRLTVQLTLDDRKAIARAAFGKRKAISRTEAVQWLTAVQNGSVALCRKRYAEHVVDPQKSQGVFPFAQAVDCAGQV